MPQLVTIPEDSIVEIHDVTVKRGCYGLVSRTGLTSGLITDTADASRLSFTGLRLTGPSKNSMGIPGRSMSIISAVRAATPNSCSTSSSDMPRSGLTRTLFGLSSPSSTSALSGSRVFREGLRTRTETLNRAIVPTRNSSNQARGECMLTCALRAASALRKSTRFDVLSQIRGKYSMLLAKTEKNAQPSSGVKPSSKVPLVHSIAEFRQRKLKRFGRDHSLNSSDAQSTVTLRSSPRENRVAFSENRRLTGQNSNEFLTSRVIEVHTGLPKLLLSNPHTGALSGAMCVSGVQFSAKSIAH